MPIRPWLITEFMWQATMGVYIVLERNRKDIQ
jgi:hypothetical protein